MSRIEKVGKEKHVAYLTKATEFHRAMQQAAEAGAWNMVGLAAVHVVISASDALTAFYLGERSRGQSHEDVAKLLRRIESPDVDSKVEIALRVLQAKNQVEYEASLLTQRQAEDMLKRADRFFAWARDRLS